MIKSGEKRGYSRSAFEINKMLPKSKRSQVTIFIIIGLVIVALAIAIYFLLPKIKNTSTTSDENPYVFMQKCLEDDLAQSVNTTSNQGGSITPENYFLYEDERLEYLCYTNEYYKPCVVQQPLLISHIEKEINNDMKDEISLCLNDLKSTFEKRGYTVVLNKGGSQVELLPKRVSVRLNSSLTLTKGDSQKYDSLSIVVNNNLYELASIANSIIKWETTYGDADPTTYMTYYRDLKVEKYKQEDGTKVYILTDRTTGNKFQFASRSIAWPSGLGFGETI